MPVLATGLCTVHCYKQLHCCLISTTARWKMWFVLLLPLTFCTDREATPVQKVVGEQLVTPVCTNVTKQNYTSGRILLIICRISTERSRGEECRLLYSNRKGFEHGCGSRFRLIMENQTVFVHLSSLTAEDSGNYTCECSHSEGTNIVRLNITVEENEDVRSSSEMPFLILAITCASCVTIFIIITGAILGYMHKIFCHGVPNRRRPEPLASHSNAEPEFPEPYDIFIQRENELYTAAAITQIYI